MELHLQPSELLIGMLVVLAAVALLAEKLKIAYPILLVIVGTLLGLIPRYVPGIQPILVDPELVFFIFLPPLLYYAGLLTTWRDFKANIRPISELALGLVLATMIAVAVAAYYTVPDMTWGAAFLLGAIVSPPDAVAATAILSKVRAPKRIVTILEGESLVNDATALVAYKYALAAALTGTFSLSSALGNAFVLAIGGVAFGLVAAATTAWVLKRIEAPVIESTVALLIPYAAYLPAEKLGGSGVLAAVAAGIYMGRKLPETGSPQTRMNTLAVWAALVFVFDGIIFILIGMQMFEVVTRLPGWSTLIYAASSVCITAILVRIFYVFSAASINRLFPIPRHAGLTNWRQTLVISWAGMRGIVSLAAALAVSDSLPQKDAILFLTFCVILVTLVFQGLTLSPLINFLKVKETDDSEQREEAQARLDAAHAALSRLTVLSFDESINPDAINRVRAEYDERILRLGGNPHDPSRAVDLTTDKQLHMLRLEALIAERKMITFMRDQNLVGDEVLRRILAEIDLEQAKLGK